MALTQLQKVIIVKMIKDKDCYISKRAYRYALFKGNRNPVLKLSNRTIWSMREVLLDVDGKIVVNPRDIESFMKKPWFNKIHA